MGAKCIRLSVTQLQARWMPMRLRRFSKSAMVSGGRWVSCHDLGWVAQLSYRILFCAVPYLAYRGGECWPVIGRYSQHSPFHALRIRVYRYLRDRSG